MGLFSGIGKMFNDVMGVNASSNQAYRQSRAMANLSFDQEKYFASNAHQLEMQDLASAGLNPALTTGASSAGSIASDGGTGNAGYTGSSAGISPMGIIEAINSTRQTNADVKLKGQEGEAQTYAGMAQMVNALKGLKELKWIDKETNARIDKMLKEIDNTMANTKYTNERSRGFSESESESNSMDGGAFGIKAGGSHQKSYSRSW